MSLLFDDNGMLSENWDESWVFFTFSIKKESVET